VLKLNGAIHAVIRWALLAISDGLFTGRGLSVEVRAGKNDEDVRVSRSSQRERDRHRFGPGLLESAG